MSLTKEQLIKWSRYGMEPFNWILPGKLMGSVYPREIEYLKYLKEREGIELSINLAESPWPDEWPRESGIRYHHLPIIDMSIPTREQILEAINIISEHEGPVMLHCAAGIGRTGTMIALYLVEGGMEPEKAISLVRRNRNGSIQTSAQEGLIHDWGRMRRKADGH